PDTQAATDEGRAGAVAQEVPRPEARGGEVEVEHHEDGQEGEQARPEAEDERRSDGELGNGHQPGEERCARDRNRLEVPADWRPRGGAPALEALEQQVAV